MDKKFDDIRPYYDSEIPAAMMRIASSSALSVLSSFVFPDKNVEEVKNILLSFNTIKEFQ